MDFRRILRVFLRQFCYCLMKWITLIHLCIPGWGTDLVQKEFHLIPVRKDLTIQITRVPINQNAAKVKDEGFFF